MLTDREREVLEMVADGYRTKEIARLLHISAKTVDTHKQNIFKKTGLSRVAQLTKFAIRVGLTELEESDADARFDEGASDLAR